MAARTITYTLNMAASPRALHNAENVLTFDCNSGATKFGTVSDVFLLGKVPNGSIVTGGSLRFGVNGNAAATFTLLLLADEGSGTFSIHSTLAAFGDGGTSITGNATTAQNYAIVGGPQFKVSFSDDRAIRYATLALNCTVGPSETASFSFQGVLRYVTDGRAT
jgi:hypothetical protein